MDKERRVLTMNSLDDEGLGSNSLIESGVITINGKVKPTPLTASGGDSAAGICFKLEDNHHSHQTSDSNNSNNHSNNNGKLCVQYVNVSYHSDAAAGGCSLSSSSSLSFKSDTHLVNSSANSIKLDADGSEKRCFISLPVENLQDLEVPMKSHQLLSNNSNNHTSHHHHNHHHHHHHHHSHHHQRVLISPTDFLTLTEETTSSSAVKKDVNLSASRLEIIKKSSDANLTVSLDRYCESPFLMDTHREIHLISDDDASNNGRASGLSESHEEMPPDDLFATTLSDQHNSIREVVITPIESDTNSRATPTMKDCHKISNGFELRPVKEEKFESEGILEEVGVEENGDDDEELDEDDDDDEDVDVDRESKSEFAGLHPLPDNSSVRLTPESSSSSELRPSPILEQSSSSSSIPAQPQSQPQTQQQIPSPSASITAAAATTTTAITTTTHSQNANPNGSVNVTLPVTPLDIKILPTGLLQLAANLAAVFPSSTIQKQIALQLLREDGTSIIVPIATRGSQDSNSNVTQSNERREQVTKEPINSPKSVSTDSGPSPETDRPFKCELCNSTFTRLGNYTRHKKIHSLPSKEDQRFRCDICGKSFIQRCDLARHLHIHRGTEPHRCSQCGKGYIRHSDLVTHQRFHNKEKPFACPHCSKGFCQRGDLNRHLRSIHLQLKPILCSHCHKKFAKEETLLRHINANHRDNVVT